MTEPAVFPPDMEMIAEAVAKMPKADRAIITEMVTEYVDTYYAYKNSMTSGLVNLIMQIADEAYLKGYKAAEESRLRMIANAGDTTRTNH